MYHLSSTHFQYSFRSPHPKPPTRALRTERGAALRPNVQEERERDYAALMARLNLPPVEHLSEAQIHELYPGLQEPDPIRTSIAYVSPVFQNLLSEPPTVFRGRADPFKLQLDPRRRSYIRRSLPLKTLFFLRNVI